MADMAQTTQTSSSTTAPPNTSTPVVIGKTNTTPNSVQVGTSSRLGKPWNVSDDLLTFLAIWENGVKDGKNFANQKVTDGFILTVYKDSRKLPTVGCGHLVQAKDKLKIGDKITKKKAQELLKEDLSTAEHAINKRINVPLYQYEYDSLVSIAFNAGAHGVEKLTKLVNTGKYSEIPNHIKKYRTGGGNEGRRLSEAKLFETGEYDANH